MVTIFQNDIIGDDHRFIVQENENFGCGADLSEAFKKLENVYCTSCRSDHHRVVLLVSNLEEVKQALPEYFV